MLAVTSTAEQTAAAGNSPAAVIFYSIYISIKSFMSWLETMISRFCKERKLYFKNDLRFLSQYITRGIREISEAKTNMSYNKSI